MMKRMMVWWVIGDSGDDEDDADDVGEHADILAWDPTLLSDKNIL